MLTLLRHWCLQLYFLGMPKNKSLIQLHKNLKMNMVAIEIIYFQRSLKSYTQMSEKKNQYWKRKVLQPKKE